MSIDAQFDWLSFMKNILFEYYSMNINFGFIRHGYGCHNAIRPLSRRYENINSLEFVDPELTELGVDASIQNGKIVANLLKNLGKITYDSRLDIQAINIIGCSPLIRSMETAFFMSRSWKSPPKKIYVFPLLREIHEGSSNKYSSESRTIMDIVPSYAMKSIKEQKSYLREIGILDYFDFTFVENTEKRSEPGDISEFIKWFAKHIVGSKSPLNVFIVTHAGVLRDYIEQTLHKSQGFVNNSGFVVNTTMNKEIAVNKVEILDRHLPKKFFKEYKKREYTESKYYCPSKRCKGLCKVISSSV